MEFEQLIKRLDWLDEERRKDKTAIATLGERIIGLEGDLKTANKKIKDLNGSLSKLTVTPARLDQIETSITRQRGEITNYIDSFNDKHVQSQKQIEKNALGQFESLRNSITELHKYKDSIADLKREINAHADDELRRNKVLSDWETRMQETVKASEEVQRSQRMVEEGRKLETKRLADLHGDLVAARKRLDDVREKNDLFTDDLRRVETRVNELLSSEADRKLNQTNFIETQSRIQVERDRTWKEWETSLVSFHRNAESLERRLQEWDIAQRAVKRAQESYEDMVLKIERRINEVSEMQRLAEDRFRQEWVTFKADDQKRWTSFTLSQDETIKDLRTTLAKVNERITSTEDMAQTLHDILEQTKNANEQLFQGMLAQIHDLLSAYERIMVTK